MNIPAVKMPSRYKELDSVPEDPPYLKAYGCQLSLALCYVKCVPFPAEHAMPYDNPQAVIDGIHRSLDDDQGLIAVEKGVTAAGHRYIYSIVKTYRGQEGMQYCLTMHVDYTVCAVQVQGFFDEWGTTGIREAMVYALLANQGEVEASDNGITGWNADPYDPEYKRGNPMNRSEGKEFDDRFPDHPLTELRRLVGELIEEN